jgi:AcrR family transcriptional regulator
MAQIARRAKVSRRGFYELFEDKKCCFLAAQDPLARRLEEVGQAVSKAGEGQGGEAAIGAVWGSPSASPPSSRCSRTRRGQQLHYSADRGRAGAPGQREPRRYSLAP